MKRAYQKPTLEVESFAITQQITSCTGKKIGFNNSACVENDRDASEQMKTLAQAGWFIDGACTASAVGMDEKDGICYHTSTSLAFTS